MVELWLNHLPLPQQGVHPRVRQYQTDDRGPRDDRQSPGEPSRYRVKHPGSPGPPRPFVSCLRAVRANPPSPIYLSWTAMIGPPPLPYAKFNR